MAVRQVIKRNCEEEVITCYSAFMDFIEEKECKNLAKVSIYDYELTFRHFMTYFNFDETTPLHEINNEMFKTWTKSMLENELKPSSINRFLRDMRAFVNWCINNALLFADVKIQMVKGQEEVVKSFPDEELLAITQKPNDVNSFTQWRTWTVINWILATGNRAATVCEIRVNDIDFRNKEIVLRHTKNKRAQVIPLSPALEGIVKDYIRTWRHGASDDDYLFPNIANEKMNSVSLSQSFAKYCKARGCTHTNIHGLRHSFALNWIRNGGNEFKLQKILGHSTLEMTRRYVALATADLKADYECFSTLDTMKKSKKPRYVITKTI